MKCSRTDTSESHTDTSESRTDTSESRTDTSESRTNTPCDHRGGVIGIVGERFKCLTCGRTLCGNPSAPMEGTDDKPASSLAVAMGKRLNQAFAAREDGCNFEEAIDKADKDVRTLPDQVAKNIDRIAGGDTPAKGLHLTDPDPPKCLHEGGVFILTADVIRETGMRFECSRCGERFADNPNLFEKRNCLKEADKIINGERQDSYGAPEDSFTIIAGYWNVFLAAKLKALGIDVKDLLSPLDTTNMMVLFKQARKLGQKPSRDNYVDSCGYEAIGADRLSE